jgi:beclin
MDHNTQIMEILEELTPLSDTNVYLDTFVIGITQYGIGTINNLRLGRKPEEAVDWEEINAAWGESVLLLYTLAKKLNFTFSKYRLIPMGSHPFIQQKDQQGLTFPLHGSPAISFSRSTYFYEFWGTSTNSNFDFGMESFLFCVSELCARAISMSTTISLPY